MKIIGIVLIVLGVIGLAYGGITWTRRDKVVDLDLSKSRRRSGNRCRSHQSPEASVWSWAWHCSSLADARDVATRRVAVIRLLSFDAGRAIASFVRSRTSRDSRQFESSSSKDDDTHPSSASASQCLDVRAYRQTSRFSGGEDMPRPTSDRAHGRTSPQRRTLYGMRGQHARRLFLPTQAIWPPPKLSVTSSILRVCGR